MNDPITAQLTKVFEDILYGAGTLIGFFIAITIVSVICFIIYRFMNRDRGA